MSNKHWFYVGSVLSVLTLSGCITVDQPNSESTASKPERSSAADIIEFPESYGSVASKCDGPNRIYITTYDTGSTPSISVVPNDRRCKDSDDVIVPKEGEYYPKKNLISADG